MERKVYWTFLLVIISFIGQSLAAVSFSFGHQSPENAYTESKSASKLNIAFVCVSCT